MSDTCRGRHFLPGVARLAGAMLVAGAALLADSSQNSPRVAMLEQAGWEAIEANNYAAAVASFKDAIALDAKMASLRFGAGLAEYMLRHDTEAKAYLEQALGIDPKLARARVVLAQVVRRQNDFNEAIRQMEIVAAENPADDSVAETLDRWKRERELHERMRLEVGDFFTVSFEGPEDAALAAQALESLTKAYWRIGDLFGAYPPRSVPVVLYTREQFRDVTRSPQWAAAAFDGIIRVPMQGANEKGEDLDRVLAHEFAHALIRSLATRGLPTWLNEGLASALERDDMSWATQTIEKAGGIPPLTVLASPFGKLDGAQAQVAYAASAYAAKRLLDDVGGAAVANLLRDLGDGVDFATAFERRIQRSLDAFEASLQQ